MRKILSITACFFVALLFLMSAGCRVYLDKDCTCEAVQDGVMSTDIPPEQEVEATPPEDCEGLFATDRVVPVELLLDQAAWAAIKADPMAEEFFNGSFIFDGRSISDVGIRTKGNSSLHMVTEMGSERFPFKVDFNEYVKGQSFCGMKKLVLNNGFKDPSFIREHLAYRLFREAGLPAGRTMFVDLTVAGQHMGLYTLVQPVDDDLFLETWFGNDDGDVYKPELPDGTLTWKGDSFSAYPSIQVENNEDTTDHAPLLKLIDVLNNGPSSELEQVLDVDGALRTLAVSTLLVNLDSYHGNGHNYYLQEQDGLFSIIVWDLNEAFGNFNCGCDHDGIIGFAIDEPTCGPPEKKPLVHALLQVQTLRTQYHQHLRELVEGPFTDEVLGSWITEASDLVRPYVEADPTKFYTLDDFEKNLDQDIQADFGTISGLHAFLAARRTAVLDQLDGVAPSTNDGQGGCSGQGPGPGPGPNPQLCPDGICDEAEQANPDLCPEDCE